MKHHRENTAHKEINWDDNFRAGIRTKETTPEVRPKPNVEKTSVVTEPAPYLKPNERNIREQNDDGKKKNAIPASSSSEVSPYNTKLPKEELNIPNVGNQYKIQHLFKEGMYVN